MISDGLYDKAAASTGIKTILGTASTRTDKDSGIWASFAGPGSVQPLLVLANVASTGLPTFDGPNAFGSARWQFSCYANKYKDAKSLARAVRMEFEGFRGSLSDGTEVDSILYLGELDIYEQDARMHHVSLDVEIWFRDVGA